MVSEEALAAGGSEGVFICCGMAPLGVVWPLATGCTAGPFFRRFAAGKVLSTMKARK